MMRKTVWIHVALLTALLCPVAAHAVLIDNSILANPAINTLWDQSAQTLTFNEDVVLNQYGWWLGSDHTHIVSVIEWNNGPGASLWSTTQAWTSGYNEILPNASLTAGIEYAIAFDYLGSIGSTVHFGEDSGDPIAGSWWLNNNFEYAQFDQRFVASYSSVTNAVPEPGIFALLGIGIAGLGFTRRRKS